MVVPSSAGLMIGVVYSFVLFCLLLYYNNCRNYYYCEKLLLKDGHMYNNIAYINHTLLQN